MTKDYNDGLEDRLIQRVETEAIKHSKTKDTYLISLREYDLQLTEKGRECLGAEQIARSGEYNYYKNFKGTLDSAKQINPGLFK